MSTIRYTKLVTATTCADDETGHTVKYQPVNQDYSTGALTATQGSSELSIYFATCDDDIDYDIYVDDARKCRLFALNAVPNLGG